MRCERQCSLSLLRFLSCVLRRGGLGKDAESCEIRWECWLPPPPLPEPPHFDFFHIVGLHSLEKAEKKNQRTAAKSTGSGLRRLSSWAFVPLAGRAWVFPGPGHHPCGPHASGPSFHPPRCTPRVLGLGHRATPVSPLPSPFSHTSSSLQRWQMGSQSPS